MWTCLVEFFYSLVPTLIGVILGGAISLLATRYYYKQAGNELRDEARELRGRTDNVLEAMEQKGLVKLRRDKNNNILSIITEVTPQPASFYGSGVDPKVS